MEIENFSWNETKEYFIVVYDIFSRRNEDEFLSQLSFTQQVFQVLVFIYKCISILKISITISTSDLKNSLLFSEREIKWRDGRK